MEMSPLINQVGSLLFTKKIGNVSYNAALAGTD